MAIKPTKPSNKRSNSRKPAKNKPGTKKAPVVEVSGSTFLHLDKATNELTVVALTDKEVNTVIKDLAVSRQIWSPGMEAKIPPPDVKNFIAERPLAESRAKTSMMSIAESHAAQNEQMSSLLTRLSRGLANLRDTKADPFPEPAPLNASNLVGTMQGLIEYQSYLNDVLANMVGIVEDNI